jgi:hypothetical protein
MNHWRPTSQVFCHSNRKLTVQVLFWFLGYPKSFLLFPPRAVGHLVTSEPPSEMVVI